MKNPEGFSLLLKFFNFTSLKKTPILGLNFSSLFSTWNDKTNPRIATNIPIAAKAARVVEYHSENDSCLALAKLRIIETLRGRKVIRTYVIGRLRMKEPTFDFSPFVILVSIEPFFSKSEKSPNIKASTTKAMAKVDENRSTVLGDERRGDPLFVKSEVWRHILLNLLLFETLRKAR